MKKVAAGLFFLLLICCVAPVVAWAAEDDVVIVVDPGHGGNEAGARRTWSFGEYREELINLEISKYLVEELETYDGVTVHMTRTDNSKTMNREERLLIAKRYGADALVSVHINASSKIKDTNLTGCFACVPSKSRWSDGNSYARESRALATAILGQLSARVGMKNNGFWIDDELGIIVFGMKYKIPSMIIEHCFISNPEDCKNYMTTNAQLKALGVADAAGIANYYGLKKKTEQTSTENTGITGWEKKNGKYFYYIDGVKQTGAVKVGRHMYILGANGARKTGFVKVGGKYYYTDSRGRLKLGWQTYKKKTYYFDRETGAAVGGFQSIGGNKYYFSKKTFEQKTEWIKIGKEKYYFSKVNGRMLKNYWLHSSRSGNWFYLSKTGAAYQNTTVTIGGRKYHFNNNGVCTDK